MMRRSPLKPGKPLERKTPMSRGSGFKTSAGGAGLLRVAAVQEKGKAAAPKHAKAPKPKTPKPMKSRGMKGRAPTASEAWFMDRMGTLPCICCLKDGWENREVLLHHIDGRTKPGAHFLLLVLCAGHHQAGIGPNPTLVAVHPNKARFEARYGKQMDLLAECMAMLGITEASLINCDGHAKTEEAV